jgi:hypothetical protein
VADIDSSPSKEEEEEDDDTMQNTVVLFSNTDKFVLMQVPYLTGVGPSLAVRAGMLNFVCMCVCLCEGRWGKPGTYFWGCPANEKAMNQSHIAVKKVELACPMENCSLGNLE